MAKIQSGVGFSVDLSPLEKLQKEISGGDAFQAVLLRWAVIYSSYVRRKFVQNSKGGGDWPPLSERTIRQRMKKPKAKRRAKPNEQEVGRSFAILRDTGTLFNALTIGASGNLTQIENNVVRYGFQSVQHNDDRITISEIAAIHDLGKGRVPKREILVQPPKDVVDRMLGALGYEFKHLAGKLEFKRPPGANT